MVSIIKLQKAANTPKRARGKIQKEYTLESKPVTIKDLEKINKDKTSPPKKIITEKVSFNDFNS